MTVVNVHDAKTHLSRLLERAERGERIVIARAGRPVAILQAIEAPPRRRRRVATGSSSTTTSTIRCPEFADYLGTVGVSPDDPR